MKHLFPAACLAALLLASACHAQTPAPPPAWSEAELRAYIDAAAQRAVAKAAPTDAGVQPHSPTPPCPNCQCGCTETGKCFCKDCDHPLLTKPAAKASDDGLTLAVVSSSTCPPCQQLHDELKANAVGVPGLIYTDDRGVEARYGVTQYPTILLLRRGRVVARHTGYAGAEAISLWVGYHANDKEEPIDAPPATLPSVITYPVQSQPVYAPMFQGGFRGCASCGH